MKEKLDAQLFFGVLQQPENFPRLGLKDLEGLVRYARRAGLLANLAERAAAAEAVPVALKDIFEGAQVYAREHTRRIEWEMQQLAPLVREFDCPVIVLKGGAYLGMGLASARGRLVSDLDLMVPKRDIQLVEAVMLSHAYKEMEKDEYDQHYYRDWMHELPPMSHVARGTVVDLHHNIAPPVSRLKIDAAQLFERAVPLREDLPFLRLGDEDIVLHLCVHMFHDGLLDNVLRELCDLDALLRRFGEEDTYWARLLARAQELGVMRPLYYGIRFSRLLLDTPVPQEMVKYLDIAAPMQPLRWVLEGAMRQAILPVRGERETMLRALSGYLLFLRSHWLRMPPGMLVRHLWTQYRRRGGLKTAEQAAARAGDV